MSCSQWHWSVIWWTLLFLIRSSLRSAVGTSEELASNSWVWGHFWLSISWRHAILNVGLVLLCWDATSCGVETRISSDGWASLRTRALRLELETRASHSETGRMRVSVLELEMRVSHSKTGRTLSRVLEQVECESQIWRGPRVVVECGTHVLEEKLSPHVAWKKLGYEPCVLNLHNRLPL